VGDFVFAEVMKQAGGSLLAEEVKRFTPPPPGCRYPRLWRDPRLEARKLIPQFPRRNDGEVFEFPKGEQFPVTVKSP